MLLTRLIISFECVLSSLVDTEEVKLEKANQFFQEQKYKQHHHPVHVSHSKYEQTGYLDKLAINDETKHDVPRGYLDTLSDAKASTWDVYKHQLEDAKPPSEVDGKPSPTYSWHSTVYSCIFLSQFLMSLNPHFRIETGSLQPSQPHANWAIHVPDF